MAAYETTTSDRLRAAVPALAVHALLALALLRGLGVAPPLPSPDALKLIDLMPETVPAEEPPPPPPSDDPAPGERRADPRPEGAASPPNLHAQPTEIVAPPPAVRLPVPPPVAAAPIAGTGFDPSAGAADVPGPGTGSGGFGAGTGSGFGGGGPGGGGGAGGSGAGFTPPRWLRGSLRNSDYPAAAWEAGIGGTVSVRYTVEPDGRAAECTVTRSSGSPLLDQTTCRLIEQRFRFDPSRDRRGRPVRSQIVESHEWVVEVLPPEPGQERPRRRRIF